RAVALDNVADALVDGRLQDGEALLGAQLAVEGHHLELDALPGPLLLARELGDVLPATDLVLADWRHEPGQRIDPGDLHRFGSGGRCGERRCKGECKRGDATLAHLGCLLSLARPGWSGLSSRRLGAPGTRNHNRV